jgi:hypothetical protein
MSEHEAVVAATIGDESLSRNAPSWAEQLDHLVATTGRRERFRRFEHDLLPLLEAFDADAALRLRVTYERELTAATLAQAQPIVREIASRAVARYVEQHEESANADQILKDARRWVQTHTRQLVEDQMRERVNEALGQLRDGDGDHRRDELLAETKLLSLRTSKRLTDVRSRIAHLRERIGATT